MVNRICSDNRLRKEQREDIILREVIQLKRESLTRPSLSHDVDPELKSYVRQWDDMVMKDGVLHCVWEKRLRG